MEIQGAGGRRYRLLRHEARGAGSGRLFATRLSADRSPPSTAMVLKMAALADLRLSVMVDLLIFAFAMIMAAVTRAHGGPLARSGSGVTLPQIVVIVCFWGAVISAVGLIGMCIVRFRQSAIESRVTRADGRPAH